MLCILCLWIWYEPLVLTLPQLMLMKWEGHGQSWLSPIMFVSYCPWIGSRSRVSCVGHFSEDDVEVRSLISQSSLQKRVGLMYVRHCLKYQVIHWIEIKQFKVCAFTFSYSINCFLKCPWISSVRSPFGHITISISGDHEIMISLCYATWMIQQANVCRNQCNWDNNTWVREIQFSSWIRVLV